LNLNSTGPRLYRTERGVTFRYKDYRRNGQARYHTVTLKALSGKASKSLPIWLGTFGF
jgi:hypothetical protein